MTRKRRLQERMLDRRIPSEDRDAKDVERHGAMYTQRGESSSKRELKWRLFTDLPLKIL